MQSASRSGDPFKATQLVSDLVVCLVISTRIG